MYGTIITVRLNPEDIQNLLKNRDGEGFVSIQVKESKLMKKYAEIDTFMANKVYEKETIEAGPDIVPKSMYE